MCSLTLRLPGMKSSLLGQATNPPNFSVPGCKISLVIALCQRHGREDERRCEYVLKCLEHFKGQVSVRLARGKDRDRKRGMQKPGEGQRQRRETPGRTKGRRNGRGMERDRGEQETDRKMGRQVRREPARERQTHRREAGGVEAPHTRRKKGQHRDRAGAAAPTVGLAPAP